MGIEDILSEVLKISPEKSSLILKSRSIKKITIDDITILTFKRDMMGYPEGTVIIFESLSKTAKLIPGYPPIPRLLLLEKIKEIFPDRVVVEEKINGYNVRVFDFNNKLFTLTRGGNLCPYTYHRIMKLYENSLNSMFRDNPEIVLYGEAYGTENPYVRYEAYKGISFDYIVFDVMKDYHFVSLKERDYIVNSYGLKTPKSFGVFQSNKYKDILKLSLELEEKGVEGFVLKNPENTMKVKYTFTNTNVGDIAEGMRFFFEEGRTYIFPRVLREIFRQYELKKYHMNNLEKIYRKLGKALLNPAIKYVDKTAEGEISDEEFTLKIYDLKILDEFIEFMNRMKIPVHILNMYKDGEGYKINCIKIRRTPLKIKEILKTGISPED